MPLTTSTSSEPAPATPPARESFGYVLAVAYLAIVAVSLWHLKHRRDIAGWLDPVDVAVQVLLLLTIGGSTVFLYRLARRVRTDVQERRQLVEGLRDRETKYRSMFDNALEGMFQTTPEGRFVAANKALAHMYGYASPEHLMESLSDIGAQLYADSAQRAALMQTLEDKDAVRDFEVKVVRADGRTIWLRENVRAVRGGEGKMLYLEGTVADISDRFWSEQRRRLQYAMARVLSDASSVAEARPKILQTICEILEWGMGVVWDVDAPAGRLHCVEIWHAPHVNSGEFEAANSHHTSSAGLASDVWRTGEPKWIANLAGEASVPNAQIVLRAGLGSAFGVPVTVRGEVQHVFEFFSPKMSLREPELLQTLGLISNQLGHLIERKLAEEALRKSEMRKAAILDSALDCIVSFDAKAKISAFNPAAEAIFGCRQADVLGRDVIDLVVPPRARETYKRALAAYEVSDDSTRRGRRFEMLAQRNDGTEFPAEVAVSRIVIDGRSLFTAYFRDITQRKAAERTTSELAAVVSNCNDAIVACSFDGVVQSWNIGAETIYGYSAAEAVGKSLRMLFPEDRLDEFPQMLSSVKKGESLVNYETVRLRKDGKKISVSLTDSPIRTERGRITGVSSISRDITDRKRLEEELLQSQKMDAVGRLAGGIAHDFNNILTAILGYSDLLLSRSDERQPGHKHLAEIRKAAEFAAALTKQLLAFSRRQPLFPRVFNLNDTIRGLLKMVQRVIGEDVKVMTDLAAPSGRLKADPSQIEQVLLNLCVNARDAMPRGGTLTISTADVSFALDDTAVASEVPVGEYVRLTVTDTGAGIPPEIVKHIFEPFFTTKEKGQGTGLGLATCYGIIKQSGGYIAVGSAEGGGAQFTIHLPRVNEMGEQARQPEQRGDLPGGHGTILYVEDEIIVRRMTAQLLRGLGYTVLEAGNAMEARTLIEEQRGRRIDLLFSDVVLPDAGGKELADWLRARGARSKVLFTSGYMDQNLLRRYGIERGAAFLQKPFTALEMAQKVQESLEARESPAQIPGQAA
ncbi:MAG TPA: PAS domain S-box protein [Chthoniobacteraceae bacterium]|nr:PAS domain S-box protein [Chthoniobacteraceae bacterium]